MSESLVGGVHTLMQRSADDSSGSTFTTIAGIENISHSGLSATTVPTTDLDQQDKYQRYKSILLDAGELRLMMQFILAGYQNMVTDFERGTPWAYRIILPDSGLTTFNFQALVTLIPLDISLTDKIMCNVTMKISGAMKLTA